MLNPQATGVLRQVQQVKIKGEVTFLNQRGAVVHHGLVHLVVIVRLRHHEPAVQQELMFSMITCKLILSQSWQLILLNSAEFFQTECRMVGISYHSHLTLHPFVKQVY